MGCIQSRKTQRFYNYHLYDWLEALTNQDYFTKLYLHNTTKYINHNMHKKITILYDEYDNTINIHGRKFSDAQVVHSNWYNTCFKIRYNTYYIYVETSNRIRYIE